MNKRGISAVVAAVLIILITIAAIGILWIAFIPLLRTDFVCSDLSSQVSILASEGYTYYSPVYDVAVVQIKRNAGSDPNLTQVRIIVNFPEGSGNIIVPSPAPNQAKIYLLNLSLFDEDPVEIGVSPIFIKGKKETECSISSSVKLPTSIRMIPEGDYLVFGREECILDTDCDDSNECTTDLCDGDNGCDNDPVTDGTSCIGGVGTCQTGICIPDNCWGLRIPGCDPLDYALVSHWDFESGVQDAKGSNDGSLIGDAYITSGGALRSSNVLELDGDPGPLADGDNFLVPDSPSLDIRENITLAGWFLLKGNADYSKLIAKVFDDGGNPWELYALDVSNSQLPRFILSNGSKDDVDPDTDGWYSANGDPVVLNQWYHMAGAWDGEIMKLYINGKLNNTETPIPTEYIIWENNREINIGKGLHSIDGSLDDIMIFNMSLLDSEIWDLYCSQNLTGCP